MPPVVLCWESQAGGVHVACQWCSLIMSWRWDHCVGCTELGMLNFRFSATSRGRSICLSLCLPLCLPLHGHTGSPVLAGPTRNVTGEAMPTSLAEALTQLSFLEFEQRCNLLLAPFQPTQPLVPISPLDVGVQTASPCEVSQDASTQTSDQPVSSLSLDVAVQTIFHSVRTSSLDAAVQTFSHSTIFCKIITVLTRYRPIVLELILNCNACNFLRRRFFGINLKL